MNRLSLQERARILACLVEGNSVRATCRLTGTAKGTVLKPLADVGAACKRYHDERVFMLTSERIQCDEIWSFCYAKERNVPPEFAGQFGVGDVWTWKAIDSDTKLMVSYRVDRRDEHAARDFMEDVASRLVNRLQLSTDGLRAYLAAVPTAFKGEVDLGMLRKIYSIPMKDWKPDTRYSPGKCCGAQRHKIKGNPAREYISTSHVERQNLTHAVALHFIFYNFGRIHQTLRVAPAMHAGLTDHVWSLEEIAALADQPSVVRKTLELAAEISN